MKVLRYAEHLVSRYDTDGDGRLKASEWAPLEGAAAADADGDGSVSAEELADYIADYGRRRRIRLMPATEEGSRLPSLLPTAAGAAARIPAGADEFPPPEEELELPAVDEAAAADARRYVVPRGRLPQGLPAWFLERDLDGDGQLTQAEFSSTASPAALQQFRAYDRNADGVITPRELLGPARAPRRAAAAAPSRPASAAAVTNSESEAPAADAPTGDAPAADDG